MLANVNLLCRKQSLKKRFQGSSEKKMKGMLGGCECSFVTVARFMLECYVAGVLHRMLQIYM